MNFFDRLTDDRLELILSAREKCGGRWILEIDDVINLARTSRRLLERLPIIWRLWYTSAGPFPCQNIVWEYVDFYYHWIRDQGDRLDIDCYKLFGTLSKDAMTKFMRKSREDMMREWSDIFETWYQIREEFYPRLAAYRWAHNLIHRSYGAARKRLYDPSKPFERAVELWTENWYSFMINNYEPTRPRSAFLETVYPPSKLHDAGFEIRVDGVLVGTIGFSFPRLQAYASRSEVRAHFISLFPPPLPPQITTTTTTTTTTTNGSTTTTRSGSERRPAPLPKGRPSRSTSGGSRPIRTRERWRGPRNGRRQNGHHAFR